MTIAVDRLAALFDPVSVVVVGASDDERKWGNWLGRAALTGPRPAYLVNRSRDVVLGRAAYSSVRDVPGPVGLVALCVPAKQVPEAVDDALAAGAQAIVGIAAGFAETGDTGRRIERELARRVRDAGARLLGPNCLGLFDASSDLRLTSNPFPSGRVALLSQSGNLSLELAGLLVEHGLGFSRFVSVGNQADIELPELIEACAEHADTDVIAVYVEQFTDGRRFVEAVRSVGKPVVVLAAGSSAAAARVAASHTGSMVSASAVVDAACTAAGAYRVYSLGELADLLALLASPARPAGRRLAVLTDGGGHAAVAAELAHRSGLDVPVLSDSLRARIAGHLPSHAGTSNPVDVAGGAEQDLHCIPRVAGDLLDTGEVDALLVSGYFGGYGEYGPELAAAEVDIADQLADVVHRTGRPIAVHTMFPMSPMANRLRARRVPVFRRVESATVGLGRLAPAGPPLRTDPPTHRAAAADYWTARQRLAAAGVAFPAAELVRDEAAVVEAAQRLRAPWVLKANGLLHKSDAGGVRLGLGTVNDLVSAYREMVARLAPDGCVVEELADATGGVELIVGARRDPHFGPVVMVGIGGIFTELLDDIQVALAPIDPVRAKALVGTLRGAGLLTGARGRSPVDLDAAVRLIVAVGDIATADPTIAELEINPVLVTPAGALALDARIVYEEPDADRE
jgi:acyl-CoA synthetase (NDP forming)